MLPWKSKIDAKIYVHGINKEIFRAPLGNLSPLLPSKHINVESTLKQRWSSTFINVVSTLIFGWKWKLSRRTFIDVVSTLKNNVETTLIELRRFNVDEPMLFHRWNLVENESWADVCLPTLFQRWQNNVETALIELHWFNVDDPMLIQRWY